MSSPRMSERSSEDWLPSGWSVSVRVRRSGKKDKQYYSPSGLIFNSKVEVTRYLKTLDGGSPKPTTVKKHAVSDGTPGPGKEDKVEIKESVENHSCREVERSSSGSTGKCNAGLEKSINRSFSPIQYKENTMIEENVAKSKTEGPAASLECKDLKNVHAQESEKNAFGQIKQIGSLEDTKISPKHAPNVVFERVVAEGLPAGWIKEVKLTKKKNTVRRDPYYIDPVSGYIFRSMRDVLRYLATGDIGRLASKPKDESPIVEVENDRSSSPSEAKRQKLENNGVEGTEDESSEPVSHLTVEPMLESVDKEASVPPPDNSKSEPDKCNSSDEQKHDCGRTNCVLDSETEVPQDKQQSMDGSAGTSENPKTGQATPKSRKKKSSDLPRRTSSRLAGVVADPKVQVTRTRQATGNEVKDEELSSGPQKKRVKRGKMSKSINELCSSVEEKLEKTQIYDEKKKETKEEQKKKLADNVLPKEELVLPFELPSGDILSDPCIEFAIKTLTGVSFDTSRAIRSSTSAEQPTSVLPPKVNNHSRVEKVSEVASSSLNLPFGDSWQDPCIEFAIKTLTGAIPVDFDSDIPDLMRQQMNSSQIQARTDSNVGMDNFCRTDLLWQHSEAAADKNGLRQHSEGGPAPQQPLNIDMQRPSGSIR